MGRRPRRPERRCAHSFAKFWRPIWRGGLRRGLHGLECAMADDVRPFDDPLFVATVKMLRKMSDVDRAVVLYAAAAWSEDYLARMATRGASNAVVADMPDVIVLAAHRKAELR